MNDGSLDALFDYIVALVAGRLAENRNISVLVLEAGKYSNKLLDIPVLGVLLQKTHFDWQYTTVPQTNSCLGLNNNESIWPMGKIMGGTGMLNNMIYVRGHEEDFVDWFRNKKDFDFRKDIFPYFKKLEQWSSEDPHQGSIFVRNLTVTSILPKVILEAAQRLGFTISKNTEDCEEGFGMPKVNIHNGQRWTPSHKLISLNKPNVLVGVVGTPKILLNSGVGPKVHLNEVNITTRVDLPVGENLQDHVTTGFDLILLNQTLGIGIEQMLSPFSVFEYFWSGAGPWTFSGCEALSFLNTKLGACHKSNVQPDLQFMVMPLSLNQDDGIHLRHLIGVTNHIWDKYFAQWKETAITILPIVLHPKSRGTVRLKDSDFKNKPLIDPNYLSHEDDVTILLKGIDIIKKLANTEEMKKLGARLNENIFPGCDNFTFGTKNYWECYMDP
ncbi:hypothetical protein JTB14_015990 [Gonioctena quinquepunctata]|nr:hypothetical protein JTB14_015990 [Gonioctena quinquepunctata]